MYKIPLFTVYAVPYSVLWNISNGFFGFALQKGAGACLPWGSLAGAFEEAALFFRWVAGWTRKNWPKEQMFTEFQKVSFP